MNSIDSISPNEFLHAYLDQELAPEQEQQLYALLASDSALHLKLRELRSIRDEALKSGGALIPPADVSLRLFHSLGLPAFPVTQHAPTLLSRARQAALPLAAAASAAFLAGMLLLAMLQQPDGNPIPPENLAGDVRNEHVREHTGSIAPDAASPVQSVPRATAENLRRRKHGQTMAGSAPAMAVQQQADEAAGTRRTGENHAGTAASDLTETSRTASNGENATVAPDSRIADRTLQSRTGEHRRDTRESEPVYYADLEPVEADGFVSVEFRGLTMTSFPQVTMPTASDPWMQNMAFAAYYSRANSSFGLEYGQEPYSQHFHGLENGRPVRYEQNLLTSWITANYRYSFGSLFGLNGLRPYMTAALGTSFQLWPVSHGAVGLMYMADRRVRFHLSADASLMAYPFDDTWFTSTRTGISYGISVIF